MDASLSEGWLMITTRLDPPGEGPRPPQQATASVRTAAASSAENSDNHIEGSGDTLIALHHIKTGRCGMFRGQAASGCFRPGSQAVFAFASTVTPSEGNAEGGESEQLELSCVRIVCVDLEACGWTVVPPTSGTQTGAVDGPPVPQAWDFKDLVASRKTKTVVWKTVVLAGMGVAVSAGEAVATVASTASASDARLARLDQAQAQPGYVCSLGEYVFYASGSASTSAVGGEGGSYGSTAAAISVLGLDKGMGMGVGVGVGSVTVLASASGDVLAKAPLGVVETALLAPEGGGGGGNSGGSGETASAAAATPTLGAAVTNFAVSTRLLAAILDITTQPKVGTWRAIDLPP